jgi:2-amino-4-hydroxy-6-hydroxymethyldihydropteridine diphosphokinase
MQKSLLVRPDELNNAAIVAVGGNLDFQGRPLQGVLGDALNRLAAEGFEPLARSRWWSSAAWPDPSDPPYLNAVALARTGLEPLAALAALRRIEAAFGRRRDRPNAPRTLDLDLIAHGRTVLDAPGLLLPHPRAAERLFVMGPLAEIAPGWRHPVSGETAEALARTASVGADARPLADQPPSPSNTSRR